MDLHFLGAAGIVTGSCFLVEVKGTKILVDCGMFQGAKETVAYNYEPFRFKPSEIKYVLLTHAHLDHSGLIPKLVRDGFKGDVLSTSVTKEFCDIMFKDSAYLQEKNTETLNKRRLRLGKTPLVSLYTRYDAQYAMSHFKSIKYDKIIELDRHFSVRFKDAGHIIGSAIIELFVTEDEKKTKLVFSGDLGQRKSPIVNDPTLIQDADYVIMESTYGNRLHPLPATRKKLLTEVINSNWKKGGRIYIPSFALERTQELLYMMKELEAEGLVKEQEVYLDSPLAIKATKIFEKYTYLMDREAQERGDKLFRFPGLHFSLEKSDSIKINSIERPIIVIAGSGMCTGGRILHHLKNGIWDPKNTVLFVGYQAKGTIGRALIEGSQMVNIYGDEVVVKAAVKSIDSFSAHADYKDLIWWTSGFKKKPIKLFLVHGEEEAIASLSEMLKKKDFNVFVPAMWEKISI